MQVHYVDPVAAPHVSSLLFVVCQSAHSAPNFSFTLADHFVWACRLAPSISGLGSPTLKGACMRNWTDATPTSPAPQGAGRYDEETFALDEVFEFAE